MSGAVTEPRVETTTDARVETTTIARCWAVTRTDGMVLGFTDHDAVLDFDGIAFRPDAGMTAQALVQGLGLAVDNTEAQGVLSDDAITAADSGRDGRTLPSFATSTMTGSVENAVWPVPASTVMSQVTIGA